MEKVQWVTDFATEPEKVPLEEPRDGRGPESLFPNEKRDKERSILVPSPSFKWRFHDPRKNEVTGNDTENESQGAVPNKIPDISSDPRVFLGKCWKQTMQFGKALVVSFCFNVCHGSERACEKRS
jgi:hypothetical protein